jgi:hypothetical protein
MVFNSSERKPVVYTLDNKTVEDYNDFLILKAGNKYNYPVFTKPGQGLEKYVFPEPLLEKYKDIYLIPDITLKQLIPCFFVFCN